MGEEALVTARGRPSSGGAGFSKDHNPLPRSWDRGGNLLCIFYGKLEASQKEVDAILKLLDQYLDQCEKELFENNVRFIFLGKKDPFSEELREKMIRIEENSKNNRYIVNLALNYGGRDEIKTAFETLVAQGKREISEDDISDALYTRESPELDLIVRTGGDYRLSNFLLWQAAYAELCFTDTLWPDFNAAELDKIIEDFSRRNRRFGGVTETEE